ncbi:MFS transporter [Parerythrobacter lacustris]|uniref:MFS transporter n=1 Tax=Parerythrobacter lacustris TaxID=2969984 RepID=A0ABT1XPE2_9SPHN|nr:MFS transporter [Parerythrobacter lacustris]MCR2833524.1 MFS transporter [Parerythrobacter lacustris]
MLTDPSAPKLGFLTKLLYGSGSIGYGIKDVAFRSFLLLYYNQVVGVRAELVSLAILVALVVDAISDPIVGQWSDNIRTRWGRRHPLMLASAIPAAGSMLFLFLPPAGMTDTQTFWYILVVGCCVRTFITFFEIPSSALAPELTSDYDERTSVASYRYFFAYLGGVGMAFLTLLVFLAPTDEYPVGQLNPGGYQTFAIVGAALMFAAILISSLGTLHRVKYFKMPPPPAKIGAVATLKQMGSTFSNKGFLAILAFGVLKYTSVGMTSALNIYFGTYFFEFSSAQLAILTIDSLVGAFLALFFAPFVSKKFGKRNAAFGLAIIAVCFASAPYLLRFAGLLFENGDPRLVAAVFFFSMLFQLCGVSSAVLTHAMIGDIVEESQLRTGRRSEGLFYAANTLMQKSTSGLGVFAAGMLVAFVGIDPGSDPRTLDPEIPRMLALVYVPALIVLYVGGAGLLFAYRIDRASHEANVAELARRERQSAAIAEQVPDPAE